MKQGWEYKKLEEVASFQRGLTYSSEDEVDFSTKCVLRSNNINLENSCLDLTELKYLREDFVIPEDRMFCDNSIFICMSNGSKQHIGKVAYIKDKINYAFGGFMGLIVPNPSVQGKFVFYNLRSSQFKHFLNSIGEGANIKNLRFTDLSKYTISTPPLSTQQAIVSELDTLSGIIAECKETLKDYDALEQSIFYDMFGDPVKNEKGWEVKKLGEIGFCCSGGTPSRSNPEYFNGDIMWYSAGELNEMYLGDSVEKITETALNNCSAKICKAGSLFVGMYDTAAFKLGIAKVDSCSNQACANIQLYEDNIIWLYFTLLMMKEEALKNRHGARQKNLNLGYIKNFDIPLPPLPLQQDFATKIEAIEQMKAETKEALQEAETLFQARMDYWFG